MCAYNRKNKNNKIAFSFSTSINERDCFWCSPYSVFVFCVSIHCKLVPLSLPLWDFIKQGSVQLRPFYNSSPFHLSTSILVSVLPNHINPSFLTFISCSRVHAHLPKPHCHCCSWVVLHYYVRRKKGQTANENVKMNAVFIKNLIVACLPVCKSASTLRLQRVQRMHVNTQRSDWPCSSMSWPHVGSSH